MKRKFTFTCIIFSLIGFAYSSFLWLKSYRSPQLFGRCIHRIDTLEKAIALTFDDGPSCYTREILDILRFQKVRATFFLVGKNAEQFPSLVRQIYEEGHNIGNHSYSHEPLILKSISFMQEEILGYQGIIHFRAPYGRKLIALPWVLYQSKRPYTF